MVAYLQFFAGCLFWQIIYGKVLDIATHIVGVPFILIKEWLVIIPVSIRSYLKGLYYSALVLYGTYECGLNPIVLCAFFALELLAIAMLNGKAENEREERVMVINFFSKLAIIPIFILLYITKITFGYEVISLFSKFINWILGIPVIGAIIRFITEALSGWIAFIVFALLLVFILVMIVSGCKKFIKKVSTRKTKLEKFEAKLLGNKEYEICNDAISAMEEAYEEFKFQIMIASDDPDAYKATNQSKLWALLMWDFFRSINPTEEQLKVVADLFKYRFWKNSGNEETAGLQLKEMMANLVLINELTKELNYDGDEETYIESLAGILAIYLFIDRDKKDLLFKEDGKKIIKETLDTLYIEKLKFISDHDVKHFLAPSILLGMYKNQ